jgi:hypothetical protein
VFSLGVVLRELLVEPRFPRDVKNSEAVRLAREGFVQPMSFQPHLPQAIVQVMLRALQLAPQDRYPIASAMAFDVRRIALAMGVGDGRLVLRRALDREWGNDGSEVTAEKSFSSAPPPPPSPVRADDLYDLHDLDSLASTDDLVDDD